MLRPGFDPFAPLPQSFAAADRLANGPGATGARTHSFAPAAWLACTVTTGRVRGAREIASGRPELRRAAAAPRAPARAASATEEPGLSVHARAGGGRTAATAPPRCSPDAGRASSGVASPPWKPDARPRTPARLRLAGMTPRRPPAAPLARTVAVLASSRVLVGVAAPADARSREGSASRQRALLLRESVLQAQRRASFSLLRNGATVQGLFKPGRFATYGSYPGNPASPAVAARAGNYVVRVTCDGESWRHPIANFPAARHQPAGRQSCAAHPLVRPEGQADAVRARAAVVRQAPPGQHPEGRDRGQGPGQRQRRPEHCTRQVDLRRHRHDRQRRPSATTSTASRYDWTIPNAAGIFDIFASVDDGRGGYVEGGAKILAKDDDPLTALTPPTPPAKPSGQGAPARPFPDVLLDQERLRHGGGADRRRARAATTSTWASRRRAEWQRHDDRDHVRFLEDRLGLQTSRSTRASRCGPSTPTRSISTCSAT